MSEQRCACMSSPTRASSPSTRARGASLLVLSMRSDRFRELWASHNVRRHYAGRKSFRHPVVGLLEVNYVSLELTGDPGLVLTTYTATPGSPAEEALRLLASWAATERVAEQAGSRTESTVG